MSRFLMVFLSAFIIVHALFFIRIRVLFLDRVMVQWMVILFLIMMFFVPIASYIVERNGYDLLGRFLSLIGFYWMGIIFIAFSISLIMTIYDLIIWAINAVASTHMPFMYGKTQTLAMIAMIFFVSLYGIYKAQHIQVEQLQIKTTKLPKGIDSLKIAQISDVHLGMVIREDFLRKIAEKLESIKPDILVCTGDYVDSSLRNLDHFADLMSRIHIPYGKYAVTGNHESFSRLDHTITFLEQSGFTVLRGETKTIAGIMNITGVDDSRSRGLTGDEDHTKVLDALPKTDNGLFTLLLKHRPDVKDETIGRFELQLSGHTHKGQIFPFYFVVKYIFPHIAGFYDLGKGSSLYVNRGTGTWGPPMRILAPPEITMIELIGKAEKQKE